MTFSGNIRKMYSEYGHPVQYSLILYDNLEPKAPFLLNELVGQKVKISFDGQINCVVSGKQIRKAYGEGMSYEAFIKSPLAVESIIRPELSKAHLGIGLRDLEWEQKHDLQPHIVYLALVDKLKVGVTRKKQIPTRWIDQGAWKTIVLAETPYRQLAGEIEVYLKQSFSDKTNWRNMLKAVHNNDLDLFSEKEKAKNLLYEELRGFISSENEVWEFQYPVLQYPTKIVSLKLDKIPEIESKLIGIRGQYLIFENGNVLNIRSHAGYYVKFEF